MNNIKEVLLFRFQLRLDAIVSSFPFPFDKFFRLGRRSLSCIYQFVL